jgi:hypothetical protein
MLRVSWSAAVGYLHQPAIPRFAGSSTRPFLKSPAPRSIAGPGTPCCSERTYSLAQATVPTRSRVTPAVMTTLGSQRTKRYRQRQRNGLIVLSVTVDLAALIDLLVDGDFLVNYTENREKIREALEVAIAVWSRP